MRRQRVNHILLGTWLLTLALILLMSWAPIPDRAGTATVPAAPIAARVGAAPAEMSSTARELRVALTQGAAAWRRCPYCWGFAPR